MDLYADLPLAKGATSAALDADGKPKAAASGSSVWKAAPLMVPQSMRGAAKAKTVVTSKPLGNASIAMIPSALAGGRAKSPNASGARASPGVAKSPGSGGISIAFKPASVARRSSGTAATLKVTSPGMVSQGARAPLGQGSETQGRPMGIGLGFSTVTEVRVVNKPNQAEVEAVAAVASTAEPAALFFQANYRDEYHPSQPNSYEAYCKERENRKRLEQVKRALDKRQREQDQAGKREREQLVKDIAEGRASAIALPVAAGRGRGMTMPAWMRKKIDTNVAKSDTAKSVVGSAEEGQFDDAVPRAGLGFAQPSPAFSSAPSTTDSRLSARSEASEDVRDGSGGRRAHQGSRQVDEFGREIIPSHGADPMRRSTRQEYEPIHDDRGRHDDGQSRPQVDHRQDRNDDDRSNRHAKRTRTTSSGWDQPSRERAVPGRVVLLQNMVGPGEVDVELQDEVREECTEKYGMVENCVVYEMSGRISPEEAVRIFVQFRSPSDADKALAGLDGRFFGGRKVRALRYDDAKFERRDLTA